ncbi:MAG TPA: acyl-CoA dehydrogenase family protein [Acetobacteraceae bacterium]|jgi:alkylation response protein AidB-like acyl-CoA dehydrogenase|nr:acyl-CoA dehydrogenase family protein [Acetobacteraceae bacterium]
MEFALGEEQRLFAESLRSMLADRLPIEALRRHAEVGSGFDAELWDDLVDLGLPGLLVPERFGGAGLGVLDAAVAAEVLGGATVPAPFVGSVVMATLAFIHGATEALKDEWLPRIAAGEVRFGVAFAGLAGQTGAAAATLHDGRLSGRVTGAIDAGSPTHLLVCLADGSAAVVAGADPGVSLHMHRSIDRTRPVTDLTFDNARAVVLDAANAPVATAQRVLDAGRVVLAADTLGAAQHMFDDALAFVKQRTQFGRVIGSFQSVKHQFADMVTMLEPCRAMVWYAAYAQDALPDEARLTALHAKAHLGDVGRDIARMATEAHGGMGFTDLLGLHYWFKRISFNRQMLGGPERCREEAARLQGWA